MRLVSTLGICFFASSLPAVAQTYPDKPVRFIVGSNGGSATDITARLFAQKFADAWRVPVLVENVPGAGGDLAGTRVANAAPDGLTFYWGASGTLTINPTLMPKPSFDVQKAFAPVALLVTSASIVAVNNDVPAQTLRELIALAKTEPGKLTYASPGIGTPQHIAGEMLKKSAGVDIVHVPYRGAAFTDVLGGRVPMTVQNVGALLPMVKEKALRGLAVTSAKRSSAIPDVPTVAESGFPGFEALSWFGLLAPAGTPAPIIAKASQQAVAIAAMPDVREKVAQLGLETATEGSDAMAAIIKADTAKWAKVIKDADIKGSN